MGHVHDHRLLVMLNDAAAHRELQARKDQIEKEVRGRKRQSRTLQPGTSTRRRRVNPDAKAARQQLKQTGSVDAAAAAILSGGLIED